MSPRSVGPGRSAADGDVEHVHLGRQRRRDGGEARAAGGAVAMDAFELMDSGRMAVLTDPEGAVSPCGQAT